MATRYLTRVFDALRAVHTDIDGLVWTAHPVNGGEPTVKFGDPATEATDVEVVHIVQRPRNDEMTWERMPGGRDETVDVEIIVGTYWRNQTGTQVLARLEVLVNQIEGLWHDTASNGEYTPPTFDGAQKLGGVQGVDTEVYTGSQTGSVGSATIRLRLVSRI